MNAKMPTPMAKPRMPTRTQVRNPSRPPVATAPPTRPNRRRSDRAAHHREDEQERQHLEQARHALRWRARLRLGQRLAIDDPQHAIDAGGDSAGEVAATELRHDVFVDDAVRSRIGQRALEAVAHLDAHAPILQRAPAGSRRHRRRRDRSSRPRRRGSSTARFPRAASSGRSAPRPGCPCARSNARSFASSAADWSGVSAPARSVTGESAAERRPAPA